MVVLLVPWPDKLWPLWVTLLAAIIFECIRTQKYIAATIGELSLDKNGTVNWQHYYYRIINRPVILKNGIFLRLEEVQSRRRVRLWLASDSMLQDEWRALRQLLLQNPSMVKRQ